MEKYMQKPTKELYIGVMTGTSIDGIDLAILDFSNSKIKTIKTHSHPFPDELAKELHSLCTPGGLNEIDRMGVADAWLGKVLGVAVINIIDKAGLKNSDIKAIGCHG